MFPPVLSLDRQQDEACAPHRTDCGTVENVRCTRRTEHPLLVDMQVIVRRQDPDALRLDHLHDQALCGPKGEGDLRSPT
jgi:hypothetical protein